MPAASKLVDGMAGPSTWARVENRYGSEPSSVYTPCGLFTTGSPSSATGHCSADQSPFSASSGSVPSGASAAGSSIVPLEVTASPMRGSHTCRLASEIVRSSHRPAPCTRSCWFGSAGEVSVPSIPSDARPAASVIVPVNCGKRPAGTQGEPSNAVMRKVPCARGCPVRSSNVPANVSFAGASRTTSAPSRSRLPRVTTRKRYSNASPGSRHSPRRSVRRPSGSEARRVRLPLMRPSGPRTSTGSRSSRQRVTLSEPVAARASMRWPPFRVSTMSPSRKSGAVMRKPAGRKYGGFVRLRRPLLERHLQARHRQALEPEVANDQAARFGIHGQAARDDVHCFVIDSDAVCRQRSCDRAARAAHFDLDGGQAAQLRERELQALLCEQQPVQEQRDAAGQSQHAVRETRRNDGARYSTCVMFRWRRGLRSDSRQRLRHVEADHAASAVASARRRRPSTRAVCSSR